MIAHETAHYLESLRDPAYTRLLTLLGLPITRRSLETARAVVEACRSPAGQARLLDGVPASGRDLLVLLVLGTDLDAAYPADRERNVTELCARGVLLRQFGAREVAVLPALKHPVFPEAVTGLFAAISHRAEPRPPYGFRLALAAALMAAEHPTLTRAGDITVPTLARWSRTLLGGSRWAAELPTLVDDLRQLGVLVEHAEADRKSLRLNAARAKVVFAAPPTAVAFAALPADAEHRYLRTLGMIRALARRHPQGKVPVTTVVTGVLPSAYGPGRSSAYLLYERNTCSAWDLFHLTRELVERELLATTTDPAGESAVEVTEPPPRGAAHVIVLPSLEVLVPWDADPGQVALVGALADLVLVDRVCRFRLTKAAAVRGAHLLGREVVATLEELHGAPLPEQVAATVAGWASTRRTLRPFAGDFVVTDDPEVRALLQRLRPAPVEVATNVFLLTRTAFKALRKRAATEGIHVEPVSRLDQEGRLVRAASPVEKGHLPTEDAPAGSTPKPTGNPITKVGAAAATSVLAYEAAALEAHTAPPDRHRLDAPSTWPETDEP